MICVVADLRELSEVLQAYCSGEELIENCYRGHVGKNNDRDGWLGDQEVKELIARWSDDRQLLKSREGVGQGYLDRLEATPCTG